MRVEPLVGNGWCDPARQRHQKIKIDPQPRPHQHIQKRHPSRLDPGPQGKQRIAAGKVGGQGIRGQDKAGFLEHLADSGDAQSAVLGPMVFPAKAVPCPLRAGISVIDPATRKEHRAGNEVGVWMAMQHEHLKVGAVAQDQHRRRRTHRHILQGRHSCCHSRPPLIAPVSAVAAARWSKQAAIETGTAE